MDERWRQMNNPQVVKRIQERGVNRARAIGRHALVDQRLRQRGSVGQAQTTLNILKTIVNPTEGTGAGK